MNRSFAVTYDYLCPFARNANETIVDALAGGAAFDVSFVPFSLAQSHATDGDPAQWDLEVDEVGPGVLALLWSVAVRDNHPTFFLDFHIGLFSARHDDGRDINDGDSIASVAADAGLPSGEVATIVASGLPAETLAREQTAAVDDHGVFGVPTFIEGDEAVFVRFMARHDTADLDRVLDMLSWTNLNEFKRTTIDR